MTAYSRHGRLFEERANERMAQLLAQMGTGSPPDYAVYRQLVGQIEGLKDALKISEEADRDISGD